MTDDLLTEFRSAVLPPDDATAQRIYARATRPRRWTATPRRLALVFALCIAVATPAAVLATHLGTQAAPTTASNKLAAQQDAEKLLRLVVLPPGAKRVTSAPPGSEWLLKSKWLLPPSLATFTDRRRFFQIDRPLHSVVAFLKAHRPPGASVFADAARARGTRVFPNRPSPFPNHYFAYRFPTMPNRISFRLLLVNVVALPTGGTAVRADAQDQWVWTQAPRDHVPAAVREIDITRSRWPQLPPLALRVRNAAHVQRIVGWVDSLKVVPGGRTGCAISMPGGAFGPSLTFDFRGGRGRLLAQITMPDVGKSTPDCAPMSYHVRGRPPLLLIGRDFVLRLQRLLNVDLLVFKHG